MTDGLLRGLWDARRCGLAAASVGEALALCNVYLYQLAFMHGQVDRAEAQALQRIKHRLHRKRAWLRFGSTTVSGHRNLHG